MHNSRFFNKLIERSYARIAETPLDNVSPAIDPELIKAFLAPLTAISVLVVQEYEQMLDEEHNHVLHI